MQMTDTLIPGTDHKRAELASALKKIGSLLQTAAIEEARALVRDLAAEWPENARVRHYARVLAPPVVSVRPRSWYGSLRSERAWLRAHAHEHPGCWLAVLDDTLIAPDHAIGAVLAA